MMKTKKKWRVFPIFFFYCQHFSAKWRSLSTVFSCCSSQFRSRNVPYIAITPFFLFHHTLNNIPLPRHESAVSRDQTISPPKHTWHSIPRIRSAFPLRDDFRQIFPRYTRLRDFNDGNQITLKKKHAFFSSIGIIFLRNQTAC